MKWLWVAAFSFVLGLGSSRTINQEGTTNAQENWNYKQMGRDWSGTCSAGGRQSPINIETTELREVNDDRPLQFFNYNRLTAFDVIVDAKHHTIKATPKGGHKIAIAGGGLPGVYKLDSFHFHWPAEHTIDSNKFIMEAHFVHIKSKYNSSTEAAKDPEGIAVLGVLYTEGKENLELFKVEQGARDGQTVLNLEHMLPHDKNEFYRYKGSLTTPSCSEAVIWTVFRNYVSASPTQVATFRGLLPEEDQAVDTNRATQPLNGRMVELWTTRGAAEYNRVQHLSPHPSLLFALLPGLSNSIQLPKFGWK